MAFEIPDGSPYTTEVRPTFGDGYSPEPGASPAYGFMQLLNSDGITAAQLQNATWRIDSNNNPQAAADFQIRTDGSVVDLGQHNPSRPLVFDFSFNPDQPGNLSDRQKQVFLGMLASVRQQDGAQWQPASLPPQLQQLVQENQLVVPPYPYQPQPLTSATPYTPSPAAYTAPAPYEPVPSAMGYPPLPFFPPAMVPYVPAAMGRALNNTYNDVYDMGGAAYNLGRRAYTAASNYAGQSLRDAEQYIGPQVNGALESVNNAIPVNWKQVFADKGIYAVAQDVRQGLSKMAGWGNKLVMPSGGTIPQEIIDLANQGQALGLPPVVTLAHWALESGYGQHVPYDSNNPFGIKSTPTSARLGFGSVDAATTEDCPDGMYGTSAGFVKFPTTKDAFTFYSMLSLDPKGPYADALPYLKSGDLKKFLEITCRHWGTDRAYLEKMKAMMTKLAKEGYLSKPEVAHDSTTKPVNKTADAKGGKHDPTEHKVAAGGSGKPSHGTGTKIA